MQDITPGPLPQITNKQQKRIPSDSMTESDLKEQIARMDNIIKTQNVKLNKLERDMEIINQKYERTNIRIDKIKDTIEDIVTNRIRDELNLFQTNMTDKLDNFMIKLNKNLKLLPSLSHSDQSKKSSKTIHYPDTTSSKSYNAEDEAEERPRKKVIQEKNISSPAKSNTDPFLNNRSSTPKDNPSKEINSTADEPNELDESFFDNNADNENETDHLSLVSGAPSEIEQSIPQSQSSVYDEFRYNLRSNNNRQPNNNVFSKAFGYIYSGMDRDNNV